MATIDRFTKRAKQVLTDANEEARRFNHSYSGTEHLLLGLVRKGEGAASGVLEILGVSIEQMAPAVFTHMGIDDAAQRTAPATFLDLKQGSRSAMNPQSSQRSPIVWLLVAVLGCALVYISRLQRALRAAQQRGDTYRDLLAELDQHKDQS